MALRFALRLEDGGDAGAVSTFATESDEWQHGDVLYDQGPRGVAGREGARHQPGRAAAARRARGRACGLGRGRSDRRTPGGPSGGGGGRGGGGAGGGGAVKSVGGPGAGRE